MSLLDLASLGSFMSGLAVLVSLVFLYFQLGQLNRQVKQAEKNQQAQIRQSRADRTVSLIVTRTDPSIALAVQKGLWAAKDISATELEQFRAYCRAAFFNWQEAFDQHRAGLMEDDEFAEFTSTTQSLLALPGFRVQWKLQERNPLGRAFMVWVGKLIAEKPSVASGDPLKEWKEAVAALRTEIAGRPTAAHPTG